MKTFRCIDCGKEKPVQKDGGTGYALDRDNRTVCYECCGKRDRADMAETGRAVLYLVKRDGKWRITNWPATLDVPAVVRVGSHNIARRRYDAYFEVDGAKWHSVTYGDNTQIAHARRLKAA